MMKFLYQLILIVFVASCKNHSDSLTAALSEAGENRNEMEKVLDFFKKKPSDSLKYEAAVFLIENMPNRKSYKSLAGFEGAFESMRKYPINDARKEIFRKIFDSVSQKVTLKNAELIADIQFLTSDYLINNIELSFESWSKLPKNKRGSFEEFCEYVLPYKSGSEPIEKNTRKKLIEKYSWVYEKLENNTPLKKIVDSITSEFGHSSITNMENYYPQPLSISQVEDTKVGTCDDGVNYIVNVFRSLGIICAKEMIPHWGNHHSLGHSWIYVKYGPEEYSTDVQGGIDLKKQYIGESIPKVFRERYSRLDQYAFSPFSQDVTTRYTPTVNINISNVFEAQNSKPVLCVFDADNIWKAVSSGRYNSQYYTFDAVGVNVLYMIGTQNNGAFIPVGYPFYIDKKKQIHFFKPSKSIVNSELLRKYGLSSPKSTRNIDWVKNLNNCVFQGASNIDFSDAVTLHTISNFKSTQINEVKIANRRKFKYVRFFSNDKESYLAYLSFCNSRGEHLKGTVIEKNNSVTKWSEGAFDENPLSFSGGKKVSLGFKFSKPTEINSIKFQVRNDNNHINIGNKYELFYWDKKWISLGKKTAKDTVMHYSVPQNSLLWLRNYTEGKEEHVFTIDSHKNQKWLGFDDF
ncbi:hypothetical protein ACFFLS_05350 [Flavobacterium procerum]|uniref:Peptide-N(4)-(N-acetyl-beta-glucosaminyl)asparagine amidase n=1 Tax=Flavobacterium procerum TaxID=1455569 RepID=A0ABV6BLZ4_9FLAO